MAAGVHRGAAAGSFSGTTLSGYRLGPVLGAGSYGEVRLAYPKGHKHPVAIKAIDKTSVADVAEVERVTREFFILQSLDHRHVIKMREVLQDDDRLYLVMEFAGACVRGCCTCHHRRRRRPCCPHTHAQASAQASEGIRATSSPPPSSPRTWSRARSQAVAASRPF